MPNGVSTKRFGLFGPGVEGFTLNFQANSLIRLTDRVTGYFIGGQFQHALEEVHQDAAERIQEAMVEHLRAKIDLTGRVQRGGERLANALLDKRNRSTSASGFRVGEEDWLNASPAALYWRRIEEGDTKTFDSNGGVFFTNSFARGSFSPPYNYLKNLSAQGGKGYGAGQMRMPQKQPFGVMVYGIGPYPAYRYTLAGKKALDSYNFLDRYETALASRGIALSRVKK